MNKKQLKKEEDFHNDKIKKAYEEYGRKFIGRFYKKLHKRTIKRRSDIFLGEYTKVDYYEYLYIYGVKEYNLKAIVFDRGNIYKNRKHATNIIDEKYLRIQKEEFLIGLKSYLKNIHLDEFWEAKGNV